MTDILVPILAGVALTFVVTGALCLRADARVEASLDPRDERDEPAPQQAHQRTDHPSSTMQKNMRSFGSRQSDSTAKMRRGRR